MDAMSNTPNVVILAGPNGAGKSTVAAALLRDTLGIHHFVNADDIARGLSAFRSESVAFAAGRIMLSRLNELAEARVDFAFETTLAGKAYVPWLKSRIASGYAPHIVFLSLPSVELAVERVRCRVADGGHGIPAPTIRRRFSAGLANFFQRYRRLSANWQFLDNSRIDGPHLVARGRGTVTDFASDPANWRKGEEVWRNA
jgi:predicted ABC-type ATPase